MTKLGHWLSAKKLEGFPMKTSALLLAVFCLISAGCSTVASGAKSLANQAGMYDYPVPFNRTKAVYKKANADELFTVKPAAQDLVGQVQDLAEQHSRPEDVYANVFRAMCLIDRDHDRVITLSEANEGADEAIKLVNDALGDLRIHDGTITTVTTPMNGNPSTAGTTK